MKDHLADILTLEVAGLITFFWVFAYGFYLIFLRTMHKSRHALIKRLLKEALLTFLAFALCFIAHWVLESRTNHSNLVNYVGVAALLMGALFFVRTCKVVVFEYLFLSSMREGVPVLLVNLVTLVISIFLAAWMLTSIFEVRLAPLLATSALLSVVLGLALQDTLGNLFAGVALQFDKPYELGDWVEVHTEKETFVGEVEEITWRATVLNGFWDEILTVPNRLMAQSQISNFSSRTKPVYRGVSILVDPRADEAKVKNIFTEALKKIPGVVQTRNHYVMLRELSEKGAMWRVVYPVENYPKQFSIVDDLLNRVQTEFKKNNIALGRFRVDAASDFKQTN